jgi:Cu+-exporting ATPase
MLSGDNAKAAQKVAQDIGIENVHAQMLPEDKSNWIENSKTNEYLVKHIIAMVGDGVNDAPSLAKADIGIAMGSGIDIAIEAASVTLMRADLNMVVAAIDISRQTWRKIQQNLFWAFAFNTIGIPLAAMGYLSPMFLYEQRICTNHQGYFIFFDEVKG